ncbi:MAG TPA: hypothetical protein PLV92_23335, partial [Pirellulaceae bacterium]|nr:hypothetical protein [Pirellulaceae bacterium]
GLNEPLRQWLISRGEAHFPASATSDKVRELAAELLLQDRFEAEKRQWTPKPGQAEYLDLVRAVVQLDPGSENTARQLKRLEEIRSYVLRKHRVETP